MFTRSTSDTRTVCEFCASAGRQNWPDAYRFCDCADCVCRRTSDTSDDCREFDTSDASEVCGEFSLDAIRVHLAGSELAPSSPDVNTGYFHPDRVYSELVTLPGIPTNICGTCAVDVLYDVYYFEAPDGTRTGCEHCGRLNLAVGNRPWAPVGATFPVGAPRICEVCLATTPNCVCPAPSSPDVAELVRGADLAPVEWLDTRRGLIGLSEVRTRRPSGSELVTWVWFTETGDSGMVDGASGRAMAITDAYVSMVRASSPAPEVYPWER